MIINTNDYISIKDFAAKVGLTTAAIYKRKDIKQYFLKNSKPQMISLEALKVFNIELITVDNSKNIEIKTESDRVDNSVDNSDNSELKTVDNPINRVENVEILNKIIDILNAQLKTNDEQLKTQLKTFNETIEKITKNKDEQSEKLLQLKDETINILKDELRIKNEQILALNHLQHENNQVLLSSKEKELIDDPSVEEIAVMKDQENKRPGLFKRLFNRKGDVE